MRPPAFWTGRPSSPAARMLAPLATLYGAVAARRLAQPGAFGAVPVICVGNFTIGGAGKTPTALALADMLSQMGHRPAFLSRGYGGWLAGPVRVEPGRHDAAEVGDEPLLLARQNLTVVSRDRPAGARLCGKAGATVIVMDDGLQNPSLSKDLSFAVVDGASGIGNGRCLPAGPLRAPLRAQWPLVDAVVVVGPGEPGLAVARLADARGTPVLGASLRPDPAIAARLAGRRVLAFAGIGRPEKFFTTLRECGAILDDVQAYADHHAYATRDVAGLIDRARRNELMLVTTEKDLVRLRRLVPATLAETVTALPVRLVFDDDARPRMLLKRFEDPSPS